MHHIEKDPELFEYDLIDYSTEPIPRERAPIRTVNLSVYEAHSRNQGFAANQTTMRYIKKDPNE
jgi:hypothetical protein